MCPSTWNCSVGSLTFPKAASAEVKLLDKTTQADLSLSRRIPRLNSVHSALVSWLSLRGNHSSFPHWCMDYPFGFKRFLLLLPLDCTLLKPGPQIIVLVILRPRQRKLEHQPPSAQTAMPVKRVILSLTQRPLPQNLIATGMYSLVKQALARPPLVVMLPAPHI